MFEANIALINKKGIVAAITLTFFVIAILCAYSFYFEGSDFAKERWPLKLLLVDFIISFVPLALTFTLAWFARQYKQTTIHIIAIVSALVQTALFPIFALVTSCYTGLDCV
jgi:hypothetical protein